MLAWHRDPAQRAPRALGIWVLRVLIGTMWWQQTLWKIPPNFDGLKYWMRAGGGSMPRSPLQGHLVASSCCPISGCSARWSTWPSLAIGVSLLLGLFSRAGALLGLLMGLNLWLGLYSAPGEWPWTYMFLAIIQALFVIDPPGRAGRRCAAAARRAGRVAAPA